MTDQKCKGARDLLPEDIERFNLIEETFRSSTSKWGYQEIKTPTLEYLHLFTSAGTLSPSMLNRVYSFLDWDGWSGERVVLRPDGTIPVARLYIENMGQSPIARLSYITSVFAFEDTGTENRERWQCGGEFIGSSTASADVEVILVAAEVLKNLELCDVSLKLSHAGILRALIAELTLSPEDEAQLLSQIRDGDWKALMSMNTNKTEVHRLISMFLNMKSESSSFLENLQALPQISTDLKTQIGNFVEVTSILDALECDYEIDITSTRGFEYYTGTCFQFLVNKKKVGGGGRYDDLIPLIGGDRAPACGFALYFDPILNFMKSTKVETKIESVAIQCANSAPQMVTSCFQLARLLRENGFVSVLDFDNMLAAKRWTIKIDNDTNTFIVMDRNSKQERHVSSIDEVVKVLGGSA